MSVSTSGHMPSPEETAWRQHAALSLPQHAYTLAVLVLQSDSYMDSDIRDAVDKVLALTGVPCGRFPGMSRDKPIP